MIESDILATTYNDVMNVYRNEYVTDDVGMSLKTLVEKYIDVQCELDKVNTSNDKFVEDFFAVNAQYTIFTKPDLDIKAGDILVVKHRGIKYNLESGVPYFYSSHTEIPARLKERV